MLFPSDFSGSSIFTSSSCLNPFFASPNLVSFCIHYITRAAYYWYYYYNPHFIANKKERMLFHSEFQEVLMVSAGDSVLGMKIVLVADFFFPHKAK